MPARSATNEISGSRTPFRARECAALVALASLGLTALSLSGCGSGNRQISLPASGVSATEAGKTAAKPAPSGRAVITIAWPARPKSAGRLIPEAASSIKVVMTYSGTVVGTQLAVRSADGKSGTVTFDALPIGTLSVAATAYASTDGTGNPLASGTGSVTIVSGTTVNFGFAMGTTVSTIALTPNPAFVSPNGTLALTATGYNSAGAALPLSSDKLTWKSSDPSVTVDGNGLVTGVTLGGKATITVTDTESTKTATVVVTVATPLVAKAPQFSPNDPAFTVITGGFTATGDTYAINTSANPPTLTDTTTGNMVATGQLFYGTFANVQTQVGYAVFDFAGDIAIGSKSAVTATGTYPVVLLTKGSFTLDGGANLSVSATTLGPGAGGAAASAGPGAGTSTSKTVGGGLGRVTVYIYDGGGSFGGLGGGSTSGVYGADFDDTTAPHLQGGSGGYAGGASGGALSIGAVGLLTIHSATMQAIGGTPTSYGGGGSGGGIALYGGGGVTFTSATINASGGTGKSGGALARIITGYGGGGGRVTVGYGASTTAPDISFINVNSGAAGANGAAGVAGVASVNAFAGF